VVLLFATHVWTYTFVCCWPLHLLHLHTHTFTYITHTFCTRLHIYTHTHTHLHTFTHTHTHILGLGFLFPFTFCWFTLHTFGLFSLYTFDIWPCSWFSWLICYICTHIYLFTHVATLPLRLRLYHHVAVYAHALYTRAHTRTHTHLRVYAHRLLLRRSRLYVHTHFTILHTHTHGTFPHTPHTHILLRTRYGVGRCYTRIRVDAGCCCILCICCCVFVTFGLFIYLCCYVATFTYDIIWLRVAPYVHGFVYLVAIRTHAHAHICYPTRYPRLGCWLRFAYVYVAHRFILHVAVGRFYAFTLHTRLPRCALRFGCTFTRCRTCTHTHTAFTHLLLPWTHFIEFD